MYEKHDKVTDEIYYLLGKMYFNDQIANFRKFSDNFVLSVLFQNWVDVKLSCYVNMS